MTRLRLPEIVVPGARLGRHVRHDPRSLAYLAPEGAPASIVWDRHIPILDQGQLGSCTGNAEVGSLASGPHWDALAGLRAGGLVLDEDLARSIYSDAEVLDGGAGLPSEDEGSSGLSVATVAKRRGYVSGYVHATSVAQAHGALASGPVMLGTDWLQGFDSPGPDGVVRPTGSSRGGHEYLCREYDAARDLWWFDNSWGTSYGLAGRFAYDTPALTSLLGSGGDVTSLVPLTAPAPTPAPIPVSPGSLTRSWSEADFALIAAWAATRHTGQNARAAAAWSRGV